MEYEILGPAPRALRLQTFGEGLINRLRRPTTKNVCLAVAYLHRGAIEPIGRYLKAILRRGGSVSIIVGIQNSSERALRDLARIIGSDNLSLYWQRGQGTFHPKFYLLADENDLDIANTMDVFIGSSNLTGAGFTYNLEMNVHFKLSRLSDATEMAMWSTKWRQLKRLPSIHQYSEILIDQLKERGAFRQSQSTTNLDDLFPLSSVTPMPIIVSTTTTYVQTLLPNDFPSSGESDAIIPRAARNANPQFWGWQTRFHRSPGGHLQRLFPNTQIHFASRRINTSSRIYEVESVANFRLSCAAVRSVLPTDHAGFLFTLQIANRTCILGFFAPDDQDFQDFYLATQQLNNSTKRWGYV